MNLKSARRGLSLTLAMLMVFTCFSAAIPRAKAAAEPGTAVYLGRNVYTKAELSALEDQTLDLLLDASRGLADFTRPEVIDYVHFVTRSGTDDGQGVELKHVKSGVEGDHVDITGASTTHGENANALGIFSPKYTDGVVLGSGDETLISSVNQGKDLRKKSPYFFGDNSTATYTAPSAEGETRTLEIYLAASGGISITATATMGGIPVAEVPAFDRSKEDPTAASNDRDGFKYVFTYTGDENEYPLVVEFTLHNSNAWAGLMPMAACILEGGANAVEVTGGTAAYSTDPFDTPNDTNGQFLPEQIVTVTADAGAFGQVFNAWTGDAEDLALLDDPDSPTATFTMPDRDVAFTATYKEAEKRTVTVTGGTAVETDNPAAEAGASIEAYAGSVITLTADPAPEGLKFKSWSVILGDVTFLDANTFVMPDGNVELAAAYRAVGTAAPGVSNNADPLTGTRKYNDYMFTRYSTGWSGNPISGTTPFSSVSNADAVSGVPQIDDNLSAPNVLDWMRFTNTGSGEQENRKAGEDGAAVNLLTSDFKGTVSNTRENAANEARKNIRLSYSDGVSPAEDSSSYCVVRTGSTPYATFTAPSAEGIERTLDVYLTFQATSNRVLTINATMPKAGGGTYSYTTTADLLPALTASKISGRYAAKFSFNFVGDADEAPLTVTFSLSGSGGNMGVHGARLTEGAPEPQIYMNVPDLTTSDKYAIVVPGSLFQRRSFPAKVVDAAGAVVDGARVTYSYEGVSESVKGETEIPGIAIGSDGMLYVYPETAETMTIAVTASATVDGKAVSATRNVRIIKNENRHDIPTRAAEDGPMGQNAEDWTLYFNDDFDGPELDATAWIPQYLQTWTIDKDNSEAAYEMVQDADGNGYLALGGKEQRPDFTEGFGGTNDGGDQPVVSLSTRDRHHQHLAEDGRGDALDPSVPDFDGLVTKYGYFETRLRLPSTGDGAHFAWWMVGAQDDIHPDMALSGPMPSGTRHGAGSASSMYDFGPGGWGNYVFYFSDQGVEYDVMEVTIDANSPNGEYNKWLPVIHKNGSRSSPSNPTGGRWYAGADVSTTPSDANPFGRYNFTSDIDDVYTEGRDTYQEFHVYGFEWDETGTKFYLDGRLVYTSPRTADYRMLTFLSVYIGRNGDGDGYGHNHGYWPKEAMIDYFRVYKKNESVPTSIVINGLKNEDGSPIEGRFNTSWDYFRKDSTVQLSATVLDQFEQPYDMSLLPESVSIKWRFSDDVGGSKPLTGGTVNLVGGASVTYPADYTATHMTGLDLNPDTGVITVAADAPVMNQDIFLTAYLADSDDPTGYYGGKFTVTGDTSNESKRDRAKYQETKFIKISDDAPKAHRIFFDEPVHAIAPGETLSVKATVYDQYNNPMPGETLTYVLSKDVTLRETADLSRDGITLSGSDLTAAWNATQGKQIMVRAQLDDNVYQNLALAVVGEQGEPPYAPPSAGGGSASETVKNPDGSTTKTVTDKATGTVTETTTYPGGAKIVTTTPKDGEAVSVVTVPKGAGSVTVTVPAAKTPAPGEVAVIVRPDGAEEVIKTSVATENGMRITVSGDCTVKIVDNSKSFADVKAGSWFSDAVQFAVSRELFNGTGKDAFSPTDGMTRGMLMTVLARLAGQDTTGGETWYSAGMEWAKAQGISDGTSPEAGITRESLVVMLYRYAKAENAGSGVLDAFNDAGQVSGWAAEAMGWAVQAGILTGKSGNLLDPTGSASRAEVAVILQRFIERIV